MNVAVMLAGVQSALQLTQALTDVVQRYQAGDLTDEQARQEWEKTRAQFQAGAAAWDQAGR